MTRRPLLAACLVAMIAAGGAAGQDDNGADAPAETVGAMTGERLGEIIRTIDPNAEAAPNGYELVVGERPVTVVFDENADRMRILTPIAPAGPAGEALLLRMLQANFDAVLDARYAIAQDIIWSVYIHPLSPLTDEQALSGLAQTVTAADTFGASFTSGALVFGGGDTNDLHQQLLEQFEAVGGQDI